MLVFGYSYNNIKIFVIFLISNTIVHFNCFGFKNGPPKLIKIYFLAYYLKNLMDVNKGIMDLLGTPKIIKIDSFNVISDHNSKFEYIFILNDNLKFQIDFTAPH